jgi:hypothetical protein
MPDIEYAFLADSADARPGQKFHVLGGGVSRLSGRAFPLVHPHLALVVGLSVTAIEIDQPHEVQFILIAPDGSELSSANGQIVATGTGDGRDTVITFAIDLWNLTFPMEGDYWFRIHVDGTERKRLPLIVAGVPGESPARVLPSAPGGPRSLDA